MDSTNLYYPDKSDSFIFFNYPKYPYYLDTYLIDDN